MATRPPGGNDTPAMSALVLRHLEDVYRAEPAGPTAVDRFACQDHWFGVLPRRVDLRPEGRTLVDDFRALTPELRAQLAVLALQGDIDALCADRASVAGTGFVELAQRGQVHWMSDLHRVAVLAGADPDDHRLAASPRPSGDAGPRGYALHLLCADETVEIGELVAAAAHFARADRPSWAVHCLIIAADSAPTADVSAALAGEAANIAAFEGDFDITARIMARFTFSDTRVLVRQSAPARALRQALAESNTVAAKATVLARLREEDLDPRGVGEALSVYALANIIDGDPSTWEGFVQACTAASVPLHPAIAAIATVYGATHVSPAPDYAGTPDGRGWSQLAGCVLSLLHEYRDLQLGASGASLDLRTRAGNRLVRTVAATWMSVILAHNQQWSELEDVLRVVMEATEIVPVPLMRLSAETLHALVEAFRGEGDAARERIDRIRADPALRRGYRLRMVLDSVEIMIDGPQGKYEHALALLSTRQPDILDLTAGPCGPVELFDFVDYALLVQQDEEAVERVRQTREILPPNFSARADFVLAASEAAIATRTTLAPAEELLARAQSLPFVYESARLRLVYAERLRRLGRTAEARRQLIRVELDMKSVQAGAWMERVQRELRACQRETPVHVADLTEQEARIAELAARGLSNKEIGARLYLSPRTVGGHLYKIFPKLGVTTRAQLHAALPGDAATDDLPPTVEEAGTGSPNG